jgi:PHP family Zn ribbon phosphoesterase
MDGATLEGNEMYEHMRYTDDHDIYVSLNGGIDPDMQRESVERCQKCESVFTIEWNEARGFSENEEYYCPACHNQCGVKYASMTPSCYLIR